MLVHPSLGKSVKFVCVVLLMVAQHCTQLGSLALKHEKTYLTLGFRDAEVLPLWDEFAFGNWLFGECCRII